PTGQIVKKSLMAEDGQSHDGLVPGIPDKQDAAVQGEFDLAPLTAANTFSVSIGTAQNVAPDVFIQFKVEAFVDNNWKTLCTGQDQCDYTEKNDHSLSSLTFPLKDVPTATKLRLSTTITAPGTPPASSAPASSESSSPGTDTASVTPSSPAASSS